MSDSMDLTELPPFFRSSEAFLEVLNAQFPTGLQRCALRGLGSPGIMAWASVSKEEYSR